MASNYYTDRFYASQGRNPNLGQVDPRLVSIMSSAASYLPDGYRVVVNEGYNPNGHVANSQHHIAGKGALDVQIVGPNGPIPNKGADTTGLYTKLAQNAYGVMLATHPELKGQLAWGGAFGTTAKSGVPDLMHFDIGGERGTAARRLSAMGPIAGQNYAAAAGVPTPPMDIGQTAQGKQMPLGMGRGQISRGPAVSQLQQQLAAAGLNPGSPDGIFGPKTAAAVRQAESKYNLALDKGIAGPQVQAALASQGRTNDILGLPPSLAPSATAPMSPTQYAMGGVPKMPGGPSPASGALAASGMQGFALGGIPALPPGSATMAGGDLGASATLPMQIMPPVGNAPSMRGGMGFDQAVTPTAAGTTSVGLGHGVDARLAANVPPQAPNVSPDPNQFGPDLAFLSRLAQPMDTSLPSMVPGAAPEPLSAGLADAIQRGSYRDQRGFGTVPPGGYPYPSIAEAKVGPSPRQGLADLYSSANFGPLADAMAASPMRDTPGSVAKSVPGPDFTDRLGQSIAGFGSDMGNAFRSAAAQLGFGPSSASAAGMPPVNPSYRAPAVLPGNQGPELFGAPSNDPISFSQGWPTLKGTGGGFPAAPASVSSRFTSEANPPAVAPWGSMPGEVVGSWPSVAPSFGPAVPQIVPTPPPSLDTSISGSKADQAKTVLKQIAAGTFGAPGAATAPWSSPSAGSPYGGSYGQTSGGPGGVFNAPGYGAWSPSGYTPGGTPYNNNIGQTVDQYGNPQTVGSYTMNGQTHTYSY